MKRKLLDDYERNQLLVNERKILKALKVYLPKDLWKLWNLYLAGKGYLEIKKKLHLKRREDVTYSLIRLGQFLAFFKIEVLGYDVKILLEELNKWRCRDG